MIDIKQAVSAALIHFVWQGFLVACLLWVLLFLMRRRTANARYLASCTALVCLVALPAITILSPHRETGATIALQAAGIPIAVTAGLESAGWFAVLQAWALPLWSLGVVVFSLRLIWACREVALLKRRAVKANSAILDMIAGVKTRMGLTASVQVLMSDGADGPSVIGWIRPVILLPAATILGLTSEQLEAILAHECAHIRRHDYLVNLLQTLVETLLFYHPAVWWVSSRIRHERELCCDDIAVQSCGDMLEYARALTNLEKLRLTSPKLAMGVSDKSLLYRIQRLAGVTEQDARPARLPAVLALCLGLACLAVSMNWARGQTSGDGVVIVQVTLDAAGDVSDARVLSGPVQLRKAALESALQRHFTNGVAGSTREISIAPQPPSPNQEATSEFLRKEYEKATRNAEALNAKLKIFEISGRKLNSVQIDVASDQLRGKLLSHLPLAGVRVGDTLSPESITRMVAAVKQVDEHLLVTRAKLGDNQVVILITEAK